MNIYRLTHYNCAIYAAHTPPQYEYSCFAINGIIFRQITCCATTYQSRRILSLRDSKFLPKRAPPTHCSRPHRASPPSRATDPISADRRVSRARGGAWVGPGPYRRCAGRLSNATSGRRPGRMVRRSTKRASPTSASRIAHSHERERNAKAEDATSTVRAIFARGRPIAPPTARRRHSRARRHDERVLSARRPTEPHHTDQGKNLSLVDIFARSSPAQRRTRTQKNR